MALGMTPAGFPPPASENFPRYIQIQFNGEDLGGPDATTINFVAGSSGQPFSVTRGEGENAGVITVVIPTV